jgi:K(+)-stimulated pyrophosphate-energized sodium pump
MDVIILVPICALIGLLFAIHAFFTMKKESEGDELMQKIAKAIRVGAMVYLKRQYTVVAVIMVVVAIILALIISPFTGLCYLVGATLSAGAGYVGMTAATYANVRTTQSAKQGMAKAFRVSYASGTVMGLTVVGFGLLGLSLLFIALNAFTTLTLETVVTDLLGFSMGASSIALFARVGGGIFTKAADVGADLVGKVEVGIPEDDPRNPAVIADNVGDNVGDIAGMGADLYESYVGSIIAPMAVGVLGIAMFKGVETLNLVILPMMVAALGILASIVGTFFVRSSKNESSAIHKAFNIGTFTSLILTVIATWLLVDTLLGRQYIGVFWATIAGLIAGFLIGLVTEYYTSYEKHPTQRIIKATETGAATDIITGLAVGFESTIFPVTIVVVAILIAAWQAGLYGISLAGLGMLATLGITLSVDAYGPVADNAGGIAEMSHQDKSVREITDTLDAVGNTTAAIGKGFAIGGAALTALGLFAAYTQAVHIGVVDLIDPTGKVFAGILIGAVLPFLFCSFALSAVGKAAGYIVQEVRRQFKEIPGLMEGTADPDYNACITISTNAAIKQMIVPGLLAIVAPLFVGLVLGKEALAGLLVGSIATGFIVAIMMANAGGAWDNTKKYIEHGHLGGKGSPAHMAAVTGDTVGDPFKDTAGPSLNILIKLMAIVAAVFAPLFIH